MHVSSWLVPVHSRRHVKFLPGTAASQITMTGGVIHTACLGRSCSVNVKHAPQVEVMIGYLKQVTKFN